MGAHVIIHGRDLEKLNQTFSQLNPSGKHQIIQADLSNTDELMDFVKQCPASRWSCSLCRYCKTCSCKVYPA
jgi:short-subunit dehydrogenase